MMKRLSLLLATLFTASMMFAAPVFASGNGHNNNHNGDNNNDKVCVLHENNGKDYHWVNDVADLHIGDKVVKDKFCKDHGND